MDLTPRSAHAGARVWLAAGGDCQQLLKGTSWEMHFGFAKMVKRQRGGKKIRSHLHAERRILARTNLTVVPAALVRRYLPASPSHADEWKDAGPELRRRMEA